MVSVTAIELNDNFHGYIVHMGRYTSYSHATSLFADSLCPES
jgi:hypothetical protein